MAHAARLNAKRRAVFFAALSLDDELKRRCGALKRTLQLHAGLHSRRFHRSIHRPEALVFLPVLRMISWDLPEKFPYHPNWKTHVTHPAYWEIEATIDHVVPVTRGGAEEPANWVTASMARNYAKMNRTLAELGWELHPPGDFAARDGPLSWCIDYGNRHPEAVADSALRQRMRAGSTALAELRRAV